MKTETIFSDDMDVLVDKNFPRVIKYTMKKHNNKIFYGQSESLDEIIINDVKVKVNNVTSSVGNGKITYTIPVKNDSNIDAVITAEFVVDKNTLTFNITNILNNLNDNEFPIQSIEIPKQSLISVRSTQPNANFKGAVMSVNTAVSGDRGFKLADLPKDVSEKTSRYMYGFVSNNDLSAGIWSNSEYGTGAGGRDNNRITATTENKGSYITTGLQSSVWYYRRKLDIPVNNKPSTYIVDPVDMPKTKVIITGDENEDNQIDWQDGAIAFRSIMNNPMKSEEVPDLVAYRIAMNFQSEAENPFLMTLDNVKKVALNTDGLGQSVLLKGYANEGHDSGHPDYWNIGKRIGGVKDMNTLMTKGAEYGARFGIHVNASEMYPEAKSFSDNLINWKSKNNLNYGWNWLDQGIAINGLYDLASKERCNRFKKLHDLVGNKLDFIYVDVWGNGTFDSEDAWQTHQLSNEITSLGWRIAHEWGFSNEYDSTFQHWAIDLGYGSSTLNGINSEVIRFLRNHQKDSWDADYPKYGAAAQAPLLGGYTMSDFEGWQGRNDYSKYIKNLFAYNLSTKFIQHFKITKWVDGKTVQMYDPKSKSNKPFTPDKEITLKSDNGNKLQITRKSTNPKNMNDYRTRTITLNGTAILKGRSNGGDNVNYQDGDETYLIPWYWDADGKLLSDKNQKLYHWNTKGGETSWNLPTGWENVASVKVYKLTELGKTDEKTIDVKNCTITLSAKAQTPYVVTKQSETNINVEWSTGMHIKDAGFNSGNLSNWEITNNKNASIVKSETSNDMLKLSGQTALTQKITDLIPGTRYALYVDVDNRSDAKAAITVKDKSGKTLATNYTNKSIAKNYVKADAHNTKCDTVGDSGSYFQKLYVFFTAPLNSNEVSLTISRDAGKGDSYFDNIRIVENSSNNIIAQDENGNTTIFRQDFENNAQGIYPFVIGPIKGIEDNRIHLSEKHEPYTQAGWNVKKTDDVLNGNWSVKINGLVQMDNLAYQTIPQNIRFLPGVTYDIKFNYQSGSNNTYALVVGNGKYNEENKENVKITPLPAAIGKNKEFSFTLTGDKSGQSWFGIYSTNTAPNLQGTSENTANFSGYQDFILDDVEIKYHNTITH